MGAATTHPLLARPAGQRRINLPRALVAVVLILGFAGAGAVVANRIDPRNLVPAAARPVVAGHLLTGVDVRVIREAADAGLPTFADTERANLIGGPAAVLAQHAVSMLRRPGPGIRTKPDATASLTVQVVEAAALNTARSG